MRHGHDTEGLNRLKREDTVTQGGELLIACEVVSGIGDPAGFKAHQPLHESGAGRGPFASFKSAGAGAGLPVMCSHRAIAGA